MDMVLQNIRGCSRPFGGVIIMATGDPRQLPPVEGKPMWISTNMLATFRPYVLRNYVRCVGDSQLETALRMLQKNEMTLDEIEQFVKIFKEQVPLENYLASFQDAPANAYRVVSKNVVVRAISQEMTARRKEAVDKFNLGKDASAQKQAMTFQARDFVERGQHKTYVEIAGSFRAPGVKRTLNHMREEPEKLYVSEGGVYKFTVNDTRSGRFRHGQLCIVKKIHPPGTPSLHALFPTL
jgi:hypothetical protein